MKSEIAKCNESREREMPFVQEVDAKVKELRQTIANLNNKQMSLRSTIKKLKEKTVEMDDKVNNGSLVSIMSYIIILIDVQLFLIVYGRNISRALEVSLKNSCGIRTLDLWDM